MSGGSPLPGTPCSTHACPQGRVAPCTALVSCEAQPCYTVPPAWGTFPTTSIARGAREGAVWEEARWGQQGSKGTCCRDVG